ncbi:17334_t:CDS:2, partial [Gigaspora rosea]
SRMNCISAQEGILPPRDIPFYNIKGETKILLLESEEGADFTTLFRLGAKCVTPLEYVKEHLDPQTIVLDQQYIEFLQAILALEIVEIENCLKQLNVIPNYDNTKLARVNNLYDIDEQLFRRIFWNTGKLLHPALQGKAKCLNVLRKMGLKSKVDSQAFFECACEINSRIKTMQKAHIDIDQIRTSRDGFGKPIKRDCLCNNRI